MGNFFHVPHLASVLCCLLQKGGALQRVNEEACSLLLGNLVMQVHTSIQEVTEKVNTLHAAADSVERAVEILCLACSLLLSIFPVNSSEMSFWGVVMQQHGNNAGKPGVLSLSCVRSSLVHKSHHSPTHYLFLLHAGTCLLSLTHSVLSQAYSLLPSVLHLIPPEGTQTSETLGTCLKQLNQCLSAAEAMLPTWQGFCNADKNLTRESQTCFAYNCLLLASVVTGLQGCEFHLSIGV